MAYCFDLSAERKYISCKERQVSKKGIKDNKNKYRLASSIFSGMHQEVPINAPHNRMLKIPAILLPDWYRNPYF